MRNSNKIPYNDEEVSYQDDFNDNDYPEPFKFPTISDLRLFPYSQYLQYHASIIRFPFYSVQEKPLINNDFEVLKQEAIVRLKTIPSYADAVYFELVTKIALNPIQLYWYDNYAVGYAMTSSANKSQNKKLSQSEFNELKRYFLTGLIKENAFLPDFDKHKQILAQLIPDGIYLYNTDRDLYVDSETGKIEDDEAMAYLKRKLLYLKSEKQIYVSRIKKDSYSVKKLKTIVKDIEAVEKALNDLKVSSQ